MLLLPAAVEGSRRASREPLTLTRESHGHLQNKNWNLEQVLGSARESKVSIDKEGILYKCAKIN
jgi:hypothetical protein